VTTAEFTGAFNDTEARQRRRTANLVLLLVTAAWGLTFPAIHQAVRGGTDPLVFTGIRMTLAAIGLLLILRTRMTTGWKGRVLQGILLAATFYGSYAFQAAGLQYTSASRSAFITGISVVLVPLFYIPIRRRMPGLVPMLGVALSLAGLFLLTRPDAGGLNLGDILTIGCSVSYAFYIIFLESFSNDESTDAFVGLQTTFVALMSMAAFPFAGEPSITFGPALWIGLGICVPVAMFTVVALTRYQPRTTATQAAVIYSAEPLFALLFSMVWLQEGLVGLGWVGALLMMAGVLLVVLK
jgi:drug/metabolite transporter (DMT)-like permease